MNYSKFVSIWINNELEYEGLYDGKDFSLEMWDEFRKEMELNDYLEIKKIGKMCKRIKFEDLKLDEKGNGWRMYMYKDIGVFVSGVEIEKMKEKYDEKKLKKLKK